MLPETLVLNGDVCIDQHLGDLVVGHPQTVLAGGKTVVFQLDLVAVPINIVDGSGLVEVSQGVYQSNQPWGEYSSNITIKLSL